MIFCEIHSLRALPMTLSLTACCRWQVTCRRMRIADRVHHRCPHKQRGDAVQIGIQRGEERKDLLRKQSKSCEMFARARNSDDDDDAEKCSQNLPYRIQPKTQRPIPSNDTIVLQHQHLPIQVIIDQQKHRHCQDLPGPCQHHPRWTETF